MDCLKLFLCYDRRAREWETKENNYITQLKHLQDSLQQLVEQQREFHDYAVNEKLNWQVKEASLNERITELQNDLHQKEVVTQQYRVYEDNFQQERKQILQLQVELIECRDKIDNLEKEIKRLNDVIGSYQKKMDLFVGTNNREEVSDATKNNNNDHAVDGHVSDDYQTKNEQNLGWNGEKVAKLDVITSEKQLIKNCTTIVETVAN